ncbi:hypothetical protein ACI2JR_01170 [Klebsiella sp. NPDC088457]|uniref:hypothetical protein n=1 Tax=Raoultella sp. BIGb0138 TaxID=2485115 RepID=UPI00104B8CE7|nr:hypothetical protein [Raoultella sp. BIGb0138]
MTDVQFPASTGKADFNCCTLLYYQGITKYFPRKRELLRLDEQRVSGRISAELFSQTVHGILAEKAQSLGSLLAANYAITGKGCGMPPC